MLSRVFSSTAVGKHQFFGAQPSFWSNSHIHTWLLKNHSFDYMDLLIVLSVFLFLLRYRSSLYILDINLYKIIWKYFLPLCLLPFCSFDCVLLILMQSNLFILTFVTSVFGPITKTHCRSQCHETFFMFSTKSFIDLEVIFVFNSFWVNFYYIFQSKNPIHSFAHWYPVFPTLFF